MTPAAPCPNRPILMMACYFPPMVAPGCARSVGFASYLPQFGLNPTVLTSPTLFGYLNDPAQFDPVASGIEVHRPASDAWSRYEASSQRRLRLPLAPREHRTITRRLRRASETPDLSDAGWALLGACLDLVERTDAAAIWATAPPFAWIKIAAEASRISGVPLILDYRDPLTYGALAAWENEAARQAGLWWECRVLGQAARVVFASDMTRERMAELYPDLSTRFLTIPSGFDRAAPIAPPGPVVSRSRMAIAFVGSLYAHRPPDAFLQALRLVVDTHPEVAASIHVEFVGRCESAREAAASLDLDAWVTATPTVPVAHSRRRMREADVLLLLQTRDDQSDCVSGKVYEYLAAGRPILAVVTPGGANDRLLREAGVTHSIATTDCQGVAMAIVDLWSRWKRGQLMTNVQSSWLERFEMRQLAGRLAEVVVASCRLPE
ncbi:MAG: glycosyltransferase [Acidobacteria bacterium]|nr:glycosyltransferase [Acidobacteriota bacterium]